MTREELKQMTGYITPRPFYFHNEMVMRCSMLRTCLSAIGTDAREDLVESIIMDVYLMATERGSYYGPTAFKRTVRTYYMRAIYKERGLTAKGDKPKTARAYIANHYNDEGTNTIELMADPNSLEEDILKEA